MSVWAAAEKGDLNGVKAAVENGADIEEQGGEYPAGTGLHHACYKGYFSISDYLIQSGAGLNSRNKHGSLPFHYACIYGHLDTVKLLSKRSDIRSKNDYGHTPLHLASLNGHTSVAEHLIQCGAEVNSKDKDGYMPIHYACQNMHLDTVKLLIRKGSDFTSTTNAGRTPLHLASLTANTAVADYLLSPEAAGKRSSETLETERQLSDEATYEHGEPSTIGELVQEKQPSKEATHEPSTSGASIQGRQRSEEITFEGSESSGSAALVQAQKPNSDLTLHSPDGPTSVNSVKPTTETNMQGDESQREKKKMSVWAAAKDGDLDGVKAAVENGADIEERGGLLNGTGLHCACFDGNTSVAEYLIQRGAEINSRNALGGFPIHCACREGHLDAVKLLIDKGGDFKSTAKFGLTPILLALMNGHTSVAEYLMHHGAEMPQQCPPANLQCEELPKIAKGIVSIWKEVALRTRKLNEDDVTDINLAPLGVNERSKALTMLMRYKDKGGTRAMLAQAIKEDMEPLSEKVLQGSFIFGDDMDIN